MSSHPIKVEVDDTRTELRPMLVQYSGPVITLNLRLAKDTSYREPPLD